MSDLMDKLTQLLRHTPTPTPNEFVKNQSIDKALAEFDKKNAKARQGNGMWHRLMDTARLVLQPKDGAFMKKTYVVGGGLCAATLAVAVLSSTSLTQQMQDFKRDAGIGVENKRVEQPRLVEAPRETAAMIAPPQPVQLQRAEPSQVIQPAPLAKEKKMEVPALAEASAPPALPNATSANFDQASGGQVQAMKIMPAPAAPAAALAPAMPEGRMQGRMASAGIAGQGYGGAMGVAGMSIAPEPSMPHYAPVEGRDKFEHKASNPLHVTKEDPVSTFSIDVDTASYSFMRASLNNNVLPQKDAVRIEELVNYFPYDYAAPKDKAAPFASHVTVMPTPWNKGTKLVHIGIKGYDLPKSDKPHSNLVFLIDTSGSMNQQNKLPLLKNSMKLLLDSLQGDDTVAIVTYAGSAGVALAPTKVSDKATILRTIESFNSGGSTAGAEGIHQAYELAESNFDKKGVNRVILATDGDFNVGITDPNELKSFIERKRDTGIYLSVLGFGQGNYNDAMMQTLAQNGNGNAAYIDNLNEARKVLVEEASSTLFTIAKDVKIQVEFNPAKVAEYRLIGYETRMLKREDFNNDKVDAGEIGAGHAVTAIYEITPTESDAKLVDDLRYGDAKKPVEAKDKGGEYAFLKIRYKLPKEDVSKLITTPINASVEVASIDRASTEARFATAVAAYGQLLRGEGTTKDYSYDDVLTLAESGKGVDKFGYRAEFLNLVRLAKSASNLKPTEQGNMIQPPPIPEPQPITIQAR